MILEDIDLICMDEIPLVNNSESYAYFLSFPSNLFVNENFNSHFYTTQQIKDYICDCKNQKVLPKFVKSLNLNETHNIILPNLKKLEVTLFGDNRITGCCCYHFKAENGLTALYMGHFRNLALLEYNKVFIDLISNGINYLYLDNTRIGSNYYLYNSEIDVVREIKAIVLEYPNYKICMGLTLFGYEELIVFLLKYYKISMNREIQKIYRNYHPNVKFYSMKNSNIILCEDFATVEQLKERFNDKQVLTVRLVDKCKYKLEGMNRNLGLKNLFYSPHMQTSDIRRIIELTQPYHIKDIYEYDKITNFYKQGSINWIENNDNYEAAYSPLTFNILNNYADSNINNLNRKKSRLSSSPSMFNLDFELDKLRNTRVSQFNGRSPLYNMKNLLPKRKKSKKKITVRPIINQPDNEIKVEEINIDSENFFDPDVQETVLLSQSPTLNTFNKLIVLNETISQPYTSSNINEVIAPTSHLTLENEVNIDRPNSDKRRTVFDLINSAYELKTAENNTIENSGNDLNINNLIDNQHFIERDNIPLKIELLNYVEVDENYVDKLSENQFEEDPLHLYEDENAKINNGKKSYHIVDAYERKRIKLNPPTQISYLDDE